jgi:hypothetical protein
MVAGTNKSATFLKVPIIFHSNQPCPDRLFMGSAAGALLMLASAFVFELL